MDETGIITIQKSKKVIAEQGIKQVTVGTSADRETSITIAVAANVIGNYIRYMFIFPRTRYNDLFLRN